MSVSLIFISGYYISCILSLIKICDYDITSCSVYSVCICRYTSKELIVWKFCSALCLCGVGKSKLSASVQEFFRCKRCIGYCIQMSYSYISCILSSVLILYKYTSCLKFSALITWYRYKVIISKALLVRIIMQSKLSYSALHLGSIKCGICINIYIGRCYVSGILSSVLIFYKYISRLKFSALITWYRYKVIISKALLVRIIMQSELSASVLFYRRMKSCSRIGIHIGRSYLSGIISSVLIFYKYICSIKFSCLVCRYRHKCIISKALYIRIVVKSTLTCSVLYFRSMQFGICIDIHIGCSYVTCILSLIIIGDYNL